MKANGKIKKTFLFHPILFGLYPVLALYVFNRNEIVFSAIQQAVITSLIVTAVASIVFLLVFRSWQKAAAPISLSLLLFYSYGHVYGLAQNLSLYGRTLGRDRLLVPIWILLFVMGQILLLRSKKKALDQALNSISLFLMLFVVVQISIHLIRLGTAEAKSSNEPVVLAQDNSPSNAVDRDVYYILVDAYSRQDLLEEKLDLDISDFISELKTLGFYVPDCAQSNYDYTRTSMPSALNMNYLDALGLNYFDDDTKFQPYMETNLVMEQFKAMGYSTATFKSHHPLFDLPKSDYYYDYFKNESVLNSQASLNFQYLFLKTTMVRPLMEFLERNPDITLPSYLAAWIPTGNTLDSREYRQYRQNEFALDSLQKIPELPGKKFIYAHLLTTHQPFVYYPDGRFRPNLKQGPLQYRDQVVYTNTRLLEIVKTILAESDPAPIIVIQSDHSYFKGADRVKILNAYYLPDGGTDLLYSTVTPVNTFRIIFDKYFGGQYDLLPDVSVYVDENEVLHDAPSTCVPAGNN